MAAYSKKVTPEHVELSELCRAQSTIDNTLYAVKDVKRGLRDLNGNGVVAGLTQISEINAFRYENGRKIPIEGELFYRGIPIEKLTNGFISEKRYGFEETTYLLLFGSLPNEKQLKDFRQMLVAQRSLPTNFARDVIMKAPSKDIMNSLAKSVLTLASFVKVSQSVFFGRLPEKYENVKEVSFGMRLAMGIFALLCVLTGLFPDLVGKYLPQPAATAAFNASSYIDAMLGEGYAASAMGPFLPAAQNVVFYEAGVWSPMSWLLIMCILLLAVTRVAVTGKYDRVSAASSGEVDAKHALFFSGEEAVYSQVGGSDLFWGFKHNWRHYFSFMHDLHSGILNDYALWAVVDLALVMLFMLIVL
jgi:hypothetical protein